MNSQIHHCTPLRAKEKYAPFFIVGPGRSGSTLLRRMLIASDAIHIPPETYVLKLIIDRFRMFQKVKWQIIVDLILSTFEYHPEFDKFEISLRGLSIRQKKVPRDQQTLAQLLNSFYLYHGYHQGKGQTLWGDKTPLNTFCMEDIVEVFPDARFIIMCRDGRDCVASLMRLDHFSTIQAACFRWQSSVKATNTFSLSHTSSCLHVRYEALVTDTERQLKRVCAFLNIAFSQHMLHSEGLAERMGDVPRLPHHGNVGKQVFSSSIGNGKRELSDQDIDFIHQLIGEELVSLGYL